jgi:phosphatidylinositol-3-phosphatase
VAVRLLLVSLLLTLPTGVFGLGMADVRTVFVIVMENHDWSEIKGSTNAPYLNGVLLPQSAYCEQYYNPSHLHPSEPNYLWLEAGTNFGILNDLNPSANHQATTNHLTTLLRSAGISWKTYQEDISGTYVPLVATNRYTPRHNPFVYFDDVTGTNNPAWPYAISHIRPLSELGPDLDAGTVARYNFITPNLCSDMHDSCAPTSNPIRQGDDWLAAIVPQILNSKDYQAGGCLFITWDESETGDGPIGMIVLSPQVRGGGYTSNVPYTHSSLLRTLQEIFGVGPMLGDAVNALDLSELFASIPSTIVDRLADGCVRVTATGLRSGTTNVLETSQDMIGWGAISTNYVSSNSLTYLDHQATNFSARFYRVVQLP